MSKDSKDFKKKKGYNKKIEMALQAMKFDWRE